MDEVEQIKEWLRSKGTTLWGRSWDMTQDQAVVEAAEWFRDQTDQFFDWKYEQEASATQRRRSSGWRPVSSSPAWAVSPNERVPA